MRVRAWYDNFVNHSIIRQTLTENHGSSSIRIDTLARERSHFDRSRTVLVKMSHQGSRITPYSVGIDDFVRSEIDLATGEILGFESTIKSGGSLNSLVENPYFIDPSGSRIRGLPIVNTAEMIPRKGVVHKNHHPILFAEIFEDEFNVPFTATLGALQGLLSSIAQMIPFQMVMIIDSEHGVNVTEAKKPNDGEWNILLRKQMLPFTKSLNAIVGEFMETCKRYDEKIQIIVFFHAFGVMIRVKDRSSRHTYEVSMNLSDHCRSLKTLQALDPHYLSSETLWNLQKTKFPSILSSIFIDDDECESFKSGSVLQSFETIYPWRTT